MSIEEGAHGNAMVQFVQPPSAEVAPLNEAATLPPHPFSRPLVAARARLDGFKEYYDAQNGVSVELDSTSAKLHIYDKRRFVGTRRIEVVGKTALLTDIDGSLYVNDDAKVVTATQNLINIRSNSSVIGTEALDAERKAKNIRAASRTVLAGTSLVGAESLAFMMGTGPIDVPILSGIVGLLLAGGGSLYGYLYRHLTYLPRKYGRLTMTMPDYIKNQNAIRLPFTPYPTYLLNEDKKYDFLFPPDADNSSHDYVMPPYMVRGALLNTTDPVGMWDMIHEDVRQLAGSSAALIEAEQESKVALRLAANNFAVHSASAEVENLRALQRQTMEQMERLVEKVSPVLIPQLFERRRIRLTDEATSLLQVQDAQPGVANYFAELILRTALGVESGDGDSMKKVEKAVAYLKENVASVKSTDNVETVLKHLDKKIGAILVLPPDLNSGRLIN